MSSPLSSKPPLTSSDPGAWPPPWPRLWPWLRLLLALGVIVLGVVAVRQLTPLAMAILDVISPFLIGLIVAYVLHPIVGFVQHRLRLGRIAGVSVLALAIALVTAALALWLIPTLFVQIREIVSIISRSLPDRLTPLLGQIDAFMKPLFGTEIGTLVHDRLAQWATEFDEIAAGLLNQPSSLKPAVSAGGIAVRGVAEGVGLGLRAIINTLGWLGSLGFILIIAFYYLVDMSAVPPIIRKALPPSHRERVWGVLLEADQAVGGFLRGQMIAAVGVGILTTVLMFVVGLRQYAVLIGSFAGLMNLIPYLGPVAGATPAILWTLVSQRFDTWGERGLYIALIVGGMALIQAIDGFVFQPFIVGRGAHLHPLLVMLALAIGARGGIGGMIIAVPLACLAKVFWIEFFWKSRRAEDATASGAEAVVTRRKRSLKAPARDSDETREATREVSMDERAQRMDR